jgi:hypothetical protein
VAASPTHARRAVSDDAQGPSETPSIQALKNKLKRRRYERRNGINVKKSAPKVVIPAGKSEFGPDGQERASKAGLYWLHQLGQALILCGVAWDSRVTGKDCRPGYTRLELQSVQRDTTLGLRREGFMWTSHEIPNGAINNQDVEWVLKRITSPQEAALVLAKRRDLA